MSSITDETKYFIIKDWHQLIGTHREMCTKHRGFMVFFFFFDKSCTHFSQYFSHSKEGLKTEKAIFKLETLTFHWLRNNNHWLCSHNLKPIIMKEYN